jgi:hypothetical protein
MKKSILILISCFTFSVNSFGAIGAVSTATGGSGRGAIESVDGVLLNPAILSDLPRKNFSVNYSSDQWAMVVSDNGQDAYFPAAFSFLRTTATTVDTQQLGISFATPRWKKVALGGTASMVEYTNYFTGGIEQKYRQAAFDFAATVAFTKNFGIGLVAKKMASGSVALPETLQTPRTIGLGMSYTYMGFARLRFDVESAPDNKTDKLVFMGGLENYINDYVVFRLGHQNNQVTDKNYISAGLGFTGPQFGLHYAYISNTADKTEDKHLIDLGIPF